MRNRSSSICAILLAAFAALAQQPGDEKPASVEGIVTDGLTGAPVLRAHVMCYGMSRGNQQNFGAMTNAEGKFSIAGIPPGSYTVTSEKVGFVAPAPYGQEGVRLQLRAGDAKTDVRLTLMPTGAILGRVIDADGNPVEGARVWTDVGGAARYRRVFAATDQKGQYRIGGLTPGKYRVRAEPQTPPLPPEIRSDGHEDTHCISTYHPSAPDARSATRLEVRSGADVTGVDIKLLRWPMVRVSGLVTGIPPGAAPLSLNVQIQNDASGRAARVGEDGRFEIWNLEPGKWRLTAMYNTPDGPMRSAPAAIEVGRENVDNVELRIVPPFDIAGQVEYEGETARPQEPKSGPRFRANIQLLEVNRSAPTAMAEVGPDGAFRLTGVHPGRYRVLPTWRTSVKSLRLGPVTVDGNLLDLSLGSGGAPLTISMAPANAEISGTVKDEKGPAARVAVILMEPESDGGMMLMSTVTAGDGAFRFPNLPAGKYVLLATDEDDLAIRQGHYEDYEDVLVNLDVRSGDRIVKELKRHAQKP